MRKNQKGFTLVELIIAIAILAIVTLAVCGFIVVGSRSYTSANTDIMLQQDAQLAFNQISDVIIDTTDSISYGVRSGGAGDMQLVLKDSEYAGEATEKCLIVVNRQEAGSLNDNKSYWFYWNKEKEIIYFNEVEASSDMNEADIRTAFESAADMSNVSILAQHVQEFSVDISQFEENRVVMLSAVFANGNREYVTSNNVTVRNRIALNQITIDPMTRATEFTINIVNNIILEPGDFFPLSTKVDVQTPSSDKELKWELVGGAQNGTSIVESSGDLRLGIGETRTNFAVKVSRANEEYAGQNDRVSKTIIVNVKRATAVNISGPSTAKQGETVNLTGAATGNLLGVRCEACPTDVLTEDDDLITSGEYIWKIIEGNQYGQITNPTASSAVLQINADATPGAKIRVQAASKLSYDKNGGYGNPSTPTVRPVTGTYEVVIEKKADSSAIPLGSDLKFGTDNDPGPFYKLNADLPTQNGSYVFCIRIREIGDPNWKSPEDDYYYVYKSTGHDLRFAPDLFGLDLMKSYNVYLQAIYPVPKDKYEKGDYTHDSKDEIWAEYSTHLDDEGKYGGADAKYIAGEYYYATLNTPSIELSYDGRNFPGQEYYEKVINLFGSGDHGISGINLDKSRTINVDADTVLNTLRFSIYKENENGQWEWCYGFKYDDQGTPTATSGLEKVGPRDGLTPIWSGAGKLSYANGQSADYTGTQKMGTMTWEPWSHTSTFLKEENNGAENGKAIGKYHIVPGFLYTNNPHLRDGEYNEGTLIAKKIGSDFNTYYYKYWDGVINVDMRGFNLQLPDDTIENVNGENIGKERWTTFPLPTDPDFPFELGSSAVQSISRSFKVYAKAGRELTQNHEMDSRFQTLRWPGATVTCEYFSGSGMYKITIKTMTINGKTINTHVYGVYTWKPGESMWTRIEGESDPKPETITTNMEIKKDNIDYETYFPAPAESGLTFTDQHKTTSRQFVLFRKDNGGNTIVEYLPVEFWKDGSDYKIMLSKVETEEHKKTTYNYGTFKYSSGKWEIVEAGKTVEESIWDNPVEFTYQGAKYKYELDNPPKNSSYSAQPSKIYPEDDAYGYYGKDLWGALTIDYSYDSNTGKYTAVIRGTWDNNKYGTWTYNTTLKKWE